MQKKCYKRDVYFCNTFTNNACTASSDVRIFVTKVHVPNVTRLAHDVFFKVVAGGRFGDEGTET